MEVSRDGVSWDGGIAGWRYHGMEVSQDGYNAGWGYRGMEVSWCGGIDVGCGRSRDTLVM